jgi:hypothetical protein
MKKRYVVVERATNYEKRRRRRSHQMCNEKIYNKLERLDYLQFIGE